MTSAQNKRQNNVASITASAAVALRVSQSQASRHQFVFLNLALSSFHYVSLAVSL
jgi:hypothetical protein